MMDESYRHLGIATIWLRHQAAAGAGEFSRRLRQIEAGSAELNLDPGAVQIAAEIAALEPDLDDQQRLALILLVTASLAALQEGSTRLPVVGNESREPMHRILGPLCGDAFGPGGPDAMIDAIAHLLDSELQYVIGRAPEDYRPLIYLPPFIYQHRVRVAELRLAQLLAGRMTQTPDEPKRVEAALAQTIERAGGSPGANLVLSPEQRAAVVNAAGHRLALISGGPGTGKTSIILAILRVLVGMGIDPGQIALAAPTGKAAFRMGESIEQGLALNENPTDVDRRLKAEVPAARTIHRLLGFSPSRGRFTYHRNNPLNAVAVIVDEGSMLDLSLMERLAGALNPDAKLIVLGDADQLPSVAAGAVFRDVAGAGVEAAQRQERYAGLCTRLTHSYRMDTSDPAGRAVFSVARAINSADQAVVTRGTGAEGGLVRRAGPEELEFAGVEFLADVGLIEAFLNRWYAARIKADDVEKLCAQPLDERENGFDDAAQAALERIFDHMAASRILCFTRVLATGSERINAALHRRRAQTLKVAPEQDFLTGEPVIVVRNDYERMLFNGDQGVIVRIRRGGRAPAMAVFKRGGKFIAFHLPALRESLELCYATTIHKAQGSEFDAVAVVLPERDLPILTREALYTAVTRSRRSVVIAGAEELMRIGIARGIERFSGLAEELGRLLFQTR